MALLIWPSCRRANPLRSLLEIWPSARSANHARSAAINMALLTEGEPRALGCYKYGPPDGGQPPDARCYKSGPPDGGRNSATGVRLKLTTTHFAARTRWNRGCDKMPQNIDG